jgi:hypothetical protein
MKLIFDVGLSSTFAAWFRSPVCLLSVVAACAAGEVLHPRILTVNTPVGVDPDQQCGRGVHLDMHVAPTGGGDFPSSCGTTLNETEKALAFFFFDLASCVIPDTREPTPPPPR